MLENHTALSNFVAENNIARDAFGRCRFDAFVNISGSKRVTGLTEVTISFANADGYNVRLAESEDIRVEEVHTVFLVDYQTFKHDGKNLNVFGNSQKMGEYTVQITMV